MFFKKIKIVISFTLLFSIIMFPISYKPMVAAQSTYPGISAQGATLIDVNTGRILYAKNPDKKMRIASLTKIMTAIVAIENGDLDDLVITSDRAYGVEGSSIYLKRGEKLTLEDMLYGLMMRSGNDAAVAIAEHIGGSLEGFVYLMNKEAEYIGMRNSHFANPHGLDQKGHYSTPGDMAKLTAYALKNPVFKKIVSTKVKTAPLEGEKWNRKWQNKNKLLYRYEWADGVKTGYTKLAKRCLASSATKNGVQLASITLNAPDDWNDHISLFEYGFSSYRQAKLITKNEVVGKAKDGGNIVAANDFTYPLMDDEVEDINKKVIIDTKQEGRLLGKVQFYFKDKYIGSVPLERMETTFSDKVMNVWKWMWRGE